MKKSLFHLFLFLLSLTGIGFGQAYSSTSLALVPASAATDIFAFTGSSSKTVHITRVIVSCTETTAGAIDIQLIKRSTADTAGTSSSITPVPHDSQNAAATATVKSYTVNPTTGTAIGTVWTYKLACLAPATASPEDVFVADFGFLTQDLILRGNTEQLVINLNGQTITGGSFDIRVEHTEN